jgi:hypothetical protein
MVRSAPFPIEYNAISLWLHVRYFKVTPNCSTIPGIWGLDAGVIIPDLRFIWVVSNCCTMTFNEIFTQMICDWHLNEDSHSYLEVNETRSFSSEALSQTFKVRFGQLYRRVLYLGKFAISQSQCHCLLLLSNTQHSTLNVDLRALNQE